MFTLVLKAIHIVSSMFFLGFGMGSVYYKVRAYQSGELGSIAFVDREIVLADWVFTVPSGIALPLTGIWMALRNGLPLTTPWLLVGVLGWAVAGLTWLPAAFLQLRMRALSAKAVAERAALPDAYHRAHRRWLLLGIPSFSATMVVLAAMIAKAALFS